ncbi:Domain of unknown function DUF1828 [Methanocaldococcus vulcanius M7]|uniref:DUF1828 domain-containing protein n=1 Tax=Methanocaldococcus vulcanius (strain ATCC 700851 / DSM 12094 / M7) TaxID=579137 RepID=C9RFU8_METVM|nr:DUF1828 domain-containing protein [Methanocaldococcus vulcanius]ACX72450.1 Domain of unknown function DUF1828 [Methanocaldococcus vulcanius M7]
MSNSIKLIEKFIDEYFNWLRENIILENGGEWVEITTPFIDKSNDLIQFYMKVVGDSIILTDDGNTLDNLEVAGVDINTEKRLYELKTVLNGFGAHLEGREIVIIANKDEFPLYFNNMIQAILAVDGFHLLAQHKVRSIFWEDVEMYFEKKKIPYRKRDVGGRSGLKHRFLEILNYGEIKTKKIVGIISRPEKRIINSTIFAFEDVKNTIRDEEVKRIAIINDTERKPSEDMINALYKYDIEPFLWSRREDEISVLVE